MYLDTFFDTHPIFRLEELDKFIGEQRPINATTRNSLLSYYQKQGRLLRVRRGLYAVAPPGIRSKTFSVDSYLIAASLTPDAILGYHTALSLLGVAHSVREEFVCLSEQNPVVRFLYRGVAYRTTLPPRTLDPTERMTLGVEERVRLGSPVRVTGWERTLVDTLHRPYLSGGWVEVWRSLETIDVYLDIDFIVDYTLRLADATLAAKVGYFLEAHRERFLVRDSLLEHLRKHRPAQPAYVQRYRMTNQVSPASSSPHRNSSRMRAIAPWNLYVPEEAADQETSAEYFGEIAV